MSIKCPHCKAVAVKKNGSIHTGKQKYECLVCHKQFVEHPENKQINDETRERVRRSLVERVSLEGLCRIFDVSMPWLLGFMQETFTKLPEDLNATVAGESDEFEVVVLELDELWSYVGRKQNQQWLWIAMHSVSRQVVAFHVGDRTKASGEALMAKLPEGLKKKPSFTQTISQFTVTLSPSHNIDLQGSALGRRITLRDLIARFGNDAPGSLEKPCHSLKN